MNNYESIFHVVQVDMRYLCQKYFIERLSVHVVAHTLLKYNSECRTLTKSTTKSSVILKAMSLSKNKLGFEEINFLKLPLFLQLLTSKFDKTKL